MAGSSGFKRLVRGIEEIKDLPDEQETMAKQTAYF